MLLRTAATTAVLAIVLATIGAFAGPEWDPRPVEQHVVLASTDTTIPTPPGTPAVGTYQVETRDVTIQLADTTVTGRLRLPVGAPGRRTGVVFVHGAGTGSSVTAFRAQATALASAGVATLVPSKNLHDYSISHRDYARMADDYQRSVDYLRTLPGVDPDKVGLYGESEGTWIVPVMATRDARIAFTALVSAPVVRPREQAAFAVDSSLRNVGVPSGVFRAIPRAVGMQLPDGGLDYADFDVRPYLVRLRPPTLVVYGTNDRSMPVEQGALAIVADASQAGNGDVTVRYYGGADHGIRDADHQVDPTFLRDLSAWVAGLPDTATTQPRWAGAQPYQEYLAQSIPSPRWYGNGNAVLGFTIAAIAVGLLAPLVWLVVHLATRRSARARRRVGGIARDLARPLLAATLGSVATLVGLVAYLVAVGRIALDYGRDALVVTGGWLGVRLVGLATLVAVAMVVNRVSDRRDPARRWVLTRGSTTAAAEGEQDADEDRAVAGAAGAAHETARVVVRPGQPVARGWGGWALAVALTFSVVVLLLTTAYWGVFQLGI